MRALSSRGMTQEEEKSPGRPIGECIALAKSYEEVLGYPPLPDSGFAADLECALKAHDERRS
jgi:hypothetical protein